MAEVIVVSAIILIFLGTVYISYNKILSAYKSRLSYYDTTTMYELSYYRDILIENSKMEIVLQQAKTEIVNIYDSNNQGGSIFSLSPSEITTNINEKVFLLYNANKKLNGNELDSSEVNETFKEYVKYLSTSTEFKTTHVMVMERCNTKTNDINDCKYSYLEIFDPETASEYTEPVPTSNPTPTSLPEDCFKAFDDCPNGWSKEAGKCYHYSTCNSSVYGCNCYDANNNVTFNSTAFSSASQCTNMVNGATFVRCEPYQIRCNSCPAGYSNYGSAEYCWKNDSYSECAGDGWEKRDGRCYKTSCDISQSSPTPTPTPAPTRTPTPTATPSPTPTSATYTCVKNACETGWSWQSNGCFKYISSTVIDYTGGGGCEANCTQHGGTCSGTKCYYCSSGGYKLLSSNISLCWTSTSHSCSRGTLSNGKCFLYNQTSCDTANGWSIVE